MTIAVMHAPTPARRHRGTAMKTHAHLFAFVALSLAAFITPESRAQGFSQSARITSIAFYDKGTIGDGTQGEVVIDTVGGICGGDGSGTAEPFFETVVGIKVSNTTLYDLRVKSIRIRVPKANGARRHFTSRRLAPVGSNQVPSSKEQSTTVFSLFTEAFDGLKRFPRFGVIPSELGIRNVTVILALADGRGRTYTLRARVAVAFRNIDRCS